ncbi:Uncharacterised protein [Mycolicibacterium vanbaalenii]|uniref:Transmembrane protein n=1 Tax=Mycolicibacterium vanbaalenii TaxID=110539 RepID=A0A5S9RBH6_MYCVN|nr:hypothetical protein [Mycolicibacterium vanbaalenii]CAA0138236.1 Uncharacterised protein [Mycolicibacterium vanbaalenii]
MVASKLGASALAMLLVAANFVAVAHWGMVAAIALIVIDLLALIAGAVGVLVVAGYQEAVDASEAARSGPRVTNEKLGETSELDPLPKSRQVAHKAATRTARASTAASKAGAQWYKNRRDK